MPSGGVGRLQRLMRGISKTFSSCSLRMRYARIGLLWMLCANCQGVFGSAGESTTNSLLEPSSPPSCDAEPSSPPPNIFLSPSAPTPPRAPSPPTPHSTTSAPSVPSTEALASSALCPPSAPSVPSAPCFAPSPINTQNMVLPESVLRLQTRLSENLHEVWSLNKIEAGWAFGEERDDLRKLHPCLTEFENLTENAKSYDVILTMETLKTLAALGYEPCPVTPRQQPSLMDLPETYRQRNGYKPIPFDLSAIQLSPEVEDLIDSLAANLHDIWAKNRIAEGWKYGNSEDNACKRSPHLVPYDKIDWTIKKANRESVTTIVKSLLAFGSDLCTPPRGAVCTPPSVDLQRLRSVSSNDSTSSAGDSVFLRP